MAATNFATSPIESRLLPNIGRRPVPNALSPVINRVEQNSQRSSRNNTVNMSMDWGKLNRRSNNPLQETFGQVGGGGSKSRRTPMNGSLRQSLNLVNNTNLGRLPTLGLNQIKLEEFETAADNMNLFKVHNDTEKLFIQRELEREFKDIQRFDRMGLRVHEKPTQTCINRAGTIRMVNDIPALRQDKRKGRTSRNFAASTENSNDEVDAHLKQG